MNAKRPSERPPLAPPSKGGEELVSRRGLTLFEVIISLAIFVGSIAAIGQLIASGVRGAVEAKMRTQAVIRCETKMAELVAEIVPFQPSSGTFPDDPSWQWSTSINPSPQANLYIVEVTTTHPSPAGKFDVSFSLRRFVRDPQLFINAMLAEQTEAAAAASSNNTTASSTGSSSTGSSSTSSSGGSR